MAIDTKIALDNTVVVSKEQASADLGDEAAIFNLKDGVLRARSRRRTNLEAHSDAANGTGGPRYTP